MITYKLGRCPNPILNGIQVFLWRGQPELITVTKMGYYTAAFNQFHIPPDWQRFNGVLMPHGFGGDHLNPEHIVSWQKL